MLADGNQVVLVHWIGELTDQLWGRTVGLELDGRLKYSTEMDSKKRSFHGHDIIHPNTGVRMWKDRSFRQKLPPDMKRLMHLFQRLCDGERVVPFAVCHVCEMPLIDKSESCVCVLCSLGWHLKCCERVRKFAQDTSWFQHPGIEKISPAKWPEQLKSQDSTLCELCQHFVS